ncbi:MAG: hypothetical protein ACYC4L_12000 [Chloroflexota bacterium]
MDYPAQLAAMSVEQLEEALRQAELSLEDVLEERRFTLGQTGVHIGAGELSRLQRSWASDEARLRERIAAINERLDFLRGAS